MNIIELKVELTRNGMNLGDYAKALGVTNNTITKRFKDPDSFTIVDMSKTIELLKLSPTRVMDIFFSQ